MNGLGLVKNVSGLCCVKNISGLGHVKNEWFGSCEKWFGLCDAGLRQQANC